MHEERTIIRVYNYTIQTLTLFNVSSCINQTLYNISSCINQTLCNISSCINQTLPMPKGE
jgi:hypothetical protein